MSDRLSIKKRLRETPGEFHASACLGKHPFESRAVAAQVAAKKPRYNLSAYRCPFCQKFHVGSRQEVRT